MNVVKTLHSRLASAFQQKNMFSVDDDWGCDPAPAGAAPAVDAAADLEALLARAELNPAAAMAPKAVRSAAGNNYSSTSSSAAKEVELGFLLPYPDGPALPEHFPSKVGGRPVWLRPNRLPQGEQLCCGQCGRHMRFLLQLYCPRPEHDHAYHRSLMVFCCGGACLAHSNAWRAFRCTLAWDTPYYTEAEDGSFQASGREGLATEESRPSESSGFSPLPELLVSVCLEGNWQGYLSSADAEMSAEAARLLSQYEEVEGSEWATSGTQAAAGLEPPTRAQSARGAGARDRPSESSSATDDEDDGDDGDDMEDEGSFFAFQRRSSAWPEQALRYNRTPSAQPLWAGIKGRPPPGAPPPCERCGAQRTFEFQLMPQLLCSLETHATANAAPRATAASSEADVAAADVADPAPSSLDASPLGGDASALDFGVVAVYTCSGECALPEADAELSAYTSEYVWHQRLQ